MAKFSDADKQDWSVRIDVAALRRVREEAGVDLGGTRSGEDFYALSTDECKLVTILYVLCKAQIDERELTEEQFASRFAGDVLDDAAAALLEALIHFSRRDQRPALIKQRDVVTRGIQKVYQLAEAAIDPEQVEAEIESRFHATLKANSSKS